MSKFNRTVTAPVASPVKTATVATGKTHEGAPGFVRDARSELFLLAVQNMVGEKSFYESAGERDARYQSLIRQVAVEDPEWFAKFVAWLRGPEANMRSASLVAAAEGVKALLEAKSSVSKRGLISSALQRADEPGEMLGYWMNAYGRAIPKPVKRGVNDAIQRLYNEYGTLKYDTASAAVRFGDVLAITHPEPGSEPQARVFEWINARRWGRDETFNLGVVEARRAADALSRDELLANPDLLKAAGYTWENIAGKGEMDAAAWEAVIPSMGIFALLRNLRNFDKAGISREAVDAIRAKLVDPEVIAKSRLFPFRFLSAYQAVQSENWGRELETALDLSLGNVPSLTGRTLILVDRSGSMFSPVGGSLGTMTRADAAALFGVALALRAETAEVVEFGTNYRPVSLPKGASVMKQIGRFGALGGTNTEMAVRGNFRPNYHTRVIVLTDEQAWGYGSGPGVYASVPETVPVYTWNLAGYQYGSAPGEKNRYTMGGLTDSAFKIVPLLEAGKDQNWSSIFGA